MSKTDNPGLEPETGCKPTSEQISTNP